MSGQFLQKAFKELVEKHRNEDGMIDVLSLMGVRATATGPPEEVRKTMMKYYDTGSNVYKELTKEFPNFAQANAMEYSAIRRASDMGIPYWFAIDWFNTGDATCDENHPFMCLPPEGIGLIFLWKQTSTFVILAFLVILAGSLLGALLSRRKFKTGPRKYFLLGACLILDMISMASLLLPILGNVFDLFWAPLCGLLVALLTQRLQFGLAVMIKEALIFFDFVPLATIIALGQILE